MFAEIVATIFVGLITLALVIGSSHIFVLTLEDFRYGDVDFTFISFLALIFFLVLGGWTILSLIWGIL